MMFSFVVNLEGMMQKPVLGYGIAAAKAALMKKKNPSIKALTIIK